MDYKNFASTWLSLQASNRFLKSVCIFLMALNLLTLIGWLKKDTAVILIPPGLSEKSENANFVLESFVGMVTSDIRSIVTEQITQELEILKQEKVSSTFEVVQVAYEPETDKVFVTGRNRMTGAGGKSTPTDQTFEFKIDVQQYSPIITQMASYAGIPKLLSVLQKEQVKNKVEEERQKLIKN
jgi:conjugal transfer pilus assembly protein TraE